MNPLYKAAMFGKMVALKQLVLQTFYSPEEISKAIEFATFRGIHKNVIRFLLQYCQEAICSSKTLENAANDNISDLAFINLLMDRGSTPSYGAILTVTIRGHSHIVKRFLASEKANWKQKDLNKVFEYAAMNPNLDLLKTIHKAGAVPTECPLALENAVACNHIEVVKYLLDLGIVPGEDIIGFVRSEEIQNVLESTCACLGTAPCCASRGNEILEVSMNVDVSYKTQDNPTRLSTIIETN